MNVRKLDMNSLAEIYTIANTPFYLYKHFRKTPSLQSLAAHRTSDELLAMYNEYAQKQPRSLEDTVLAYTALIALTWKDYPEAREGMRNIEAHGLDWVEDIKRIFLNTAKPGQVIRIQNVSAHIVTPQERDGASNNLISVKIPLTLHVQGDPTK